MSLWLCRQEHVKHPYYVEAMGIHLYSSQELSYVIYHHPLLVLDGFVGDGLLAFLRDELGHGFLALKLERWLKSQENPDETLVLILQECDYYTPAEVSKFRQKIHALRALHPAEFEKLRADELFQLGQYGKALEGYQKLLELPKDSRIDDTFFGHVWNNAGACYARMFRLEKAMDCFQRAYERDPDPKILEQMVKLSLLNPRLKIGSRAEALVTEDLRERVKAEVEQAKKNAENSAQVKDLQALFARDSVKRQAGINKLLKQWRSEYRAMV